MQSGDQGFERLSLLDALFREFRSTLGLPHVADYAMAAASEAFRHWAAHAAHSDNAEFHVFLLR
jgi:hypothetical protein